MRGVTGLKRHGVARLDWTFPLRLKDFFPKLRGVLGAQEARQGNRNKIRVAEICGAVSVCAAHCLGDQVQGLEGVWRPEVERVQNV